MTDTDRAVQPAVVDRDGLRKQMQAKYTDVARDPEQGFHFHTARPLTRMLGYAASQDVPWGAEIDIFSGSKHESDSAEFDTRGVTFSAFKR